MFKKVPINRMSKMSDFELLLYNNNINNWARVAHNSVSCRGSHPSPYHSESIVNTGPQAAYQGRVSLALVRILALSPSMHVSANFPYLVIDNTFMVTTNILNNIKL